MPASIPSSNNNNLNSSQYKTNLDDIHLFNTFANGSTSTINSYPLSSASSLAGHSSTSINSAISSETNCITYSNHGLPPPIPNQQRRVGIVTPVRRSYNTIGLDSMKKPVLFHTKPLKNLTVYSSQSPTRSVFRSPSPSSSTRSGSCPPRRIFPQSSGSTMSFDDDFNDRDDSSLVLDANLTFVLGCKTRMKPNVAPIPAHLQANTESNALTRKISNFLQRTDHVMDEWKRFGRKDDDQMHNLRLRRSYEGRSLSRSRSATNIMIKGFQYYSRSNSCSRSSMARDFPDDATEAECDEVANTKRCFL